MKSIVLILLLTLVFASTRAQAVLVVIVTNLREIKGSVRVGLYDNDKDFPRHASVGKIVSVTGDSVRIVFDNLMPGVYAISAIHDENNNSKLDTNALGIPKEGFAFGNNAMGAFGPPPFRNAKVAVGENAVEQVLILKYFWKGSN